MNYEVDGIPYNFPYDENPATVTHTECTALKKVLDNDQMKILPKSCKVGATSASASSNGLIRRFTTPAWQTPDVAGKVNSNECHQLQETLSKMQGGNVFMPAKCNELLEKEEKDLAAQYEYENSLVLKRLKKRQSYVAKHDYPPTMC